MKKKIAKIAVLIASVSVIGLTGCISTPALAELKLKTNDSSQKILNLRNYGDTNIDFYTQSEKIMKSGFLNTGTEEYGYYDINMSYKLTEYRADSGLIILNAFTLMAGSFIFLPTDYEEYYITAKLDIYDSNRKLVKTYEKSEYVDKYAGLWPFYWGSLKGKFERRYSAMLTDIQTLADMQSSEINQALQAAGPIAAKK
jgi:hypothetical protein